MKKSLSWTVVTALFLGAFISALCTETTEAVKGEERIPLAAEFSVPGLDQAFAGYYSPVAVTVKPAVPGHAFPLSPEKVQNWQNAVEGAALSESASRKLLGQGIVSVDGGRLSEVVEVYKEINKRDLPVFVTSDSVLHLYHILFDQTLKDIERRRFAPELQKASRAMLKVLAERARASQGEVSTAYWKAAGLFAVGLKLQDQKAAVPAEIKKQVKWTLKQIEDHAGFSDPKEADTNDLFKHSEDYSQYVPRGHYTESEDLKRYFLAMMWYGRRTLLLKGDPDYGPEGKALVSPEEARAQTLAAAAVAGLVTEVKADKETVAQVWQRIYLVSAFYVGFSDDLGIPEYRTALREMFGAQFTLADLARRHQEFLEKAAKMRKPAIYSGTGQVAVNPLAGETIGTVLDKTQGFRFMGQRYVPDSYILGRLVVPTVTTLTGKPGLTTVDLPVYGPARGFPLGLDVMAVLGSERARQILDASGESQYTDYQKTLAALQAEFGALPETAWQRNLYWAWLDVLRTLLREDRGAGYPSFMNSAAWQDKQLNAALGSWAGLRHDTILYVKQSYTPTTKSAALFFGPVVGYVEPVPRFYAKLIALTRLSQKGLVEMGVLDDAALNRFQLLDQLLTRLLSLSEKELANQPLSDEEYKFIASFGENLNAIVAGTSESTQKTTMVADIHTDQNSQECMEEATGYLRLLAVAYQLPQGHILVGLGPIYSYYEFRHPISDRLTDEKWRGMLEAGKNPKPPAWTTSFADY